MTVILMCNEMLSAITEKASDWLMKTWSEMDEGRKSALDGLMYADFLKKRFEILKSKCTIENVEQVYRPELIAQTYHWLICYLLKKVKESHLSETWWSVVKKFLGTAYVEYWFFQRVLDVLNKDYCENSDIKSFLLKILCFCCLWKLEKFFPILVNGGYFTKDKHIPFIQEGMAELKKEIQNDAMLVFGELFTTKLNNWILRLLVLNFKLLPFQINQISSGLNNMKWTGSLKNKL